MSAQLERMIKHGHQVAGWPLQFTCWSLYLPCNFSIIKFCADSSKVKGPLGELDTNPVSINQHPLSVYTREKITSCSPCQSSVGKIQGDSGKFLDCFKSYLGSQISSQSLNEVYIYWLQPNSTTKDMFYHTVVFDCLSWCIMLPFDVWLCFPVTMWTLP